MIKLIKSFAVTCLFLIASNSVLSGQTESKFEQFFKPADQPDKDRHELKVLLLRMSKHDAARLLLEDDGSLQWGTKLIELKEQGLLQEVHHFEYSLRGTKGSEGNVSDQKYFYFDPITVGQRWNEEQDFIAKKLPMPDLAPLLRYLVTETVGNFFKVEFEVNTDLNEVSLDMHLFIQGSEPALRAAGVNTLQNISTPKAAFTPWELKTKVRAPVNKVFLIASQADAYMDSETFSKNEIQPDSGNVLLAFGWISSRLEKANDEEERSQEQAEAPDQTSINIQTWAVAVDDNLFHEWIIQRANGDDDEAALQRWLNADVQAEEVELMSASSVVVTGVGTIEAVRRWHDAAGFEPGFNVRQFKAIPCESAHYFLKHRLNVDVDAPATSDDTAKDPSVVLNVEWDMPPNSVKWQKWPSALERDAETDPAAIELAEADMPWFYSRGSHGFTIEGLKLPEGQVRIVAAGLRDDGRIYATFLRWSKVRTKVPDAKSQPKIAVPNASPTVMHWWIQTPENWSKHLLGSEPFDSKEMASLLLKSVKVPTIRLKAFSLMSGAEGGNSMKMGRPFHFLGNYGIRVAPHKDGLFYHPRSIVNELRGFQGGSGVSLVTEKTNFCQVNIQMREHEGWLKWGIWQPQVKDTTKENSYVRQPKIPYHVMQCNFTLAAGVPQVTAVWSDDTPKGMAGKRHPALIWQISLLSDTEQTQYGKDERGTDSLQDGPVKVLIVNAPDSENLDLQSADSVKEVMNKISATLYRVQEIAWFGRKYENNLNFSTGTEYYFPEARDMEGGYSEEKTFRATAQVVLDTSFDHVILLVKRMVGWQFAISRGNWTLEWDDKHPERSVDKFDNVELEWPFEYAQNDTAPRTSINVERPIFSFHKAGGRMPKPGETALHRIDKNTLLVIQDMSEPPVVKK